MTGFDAAVIFVIGLSALLAAIRGFAREAASILALAGAVAAALLSMGPLRAMLQNLVSGGAGLVLFAVALGVVFLAAFILFGRLADGLLKLAKLHEGGPIDKGLGFAFGAARGLLLTAVAYLIYHLMTPVERQPDWVKDGLTYPLVTSSAALIARLGQPYPEEGGAFGGEREARAAESAEGAHEAGADDPGYDRRERDGLKHLITTATADPDDDETDPEQ